MNHNKVGLPRLTSFSQNTVTRMLELREKVHEGRSVSAAYIPPTSGSRRSLYRRAKHLSNASPNK